MLTQDGPGECQNFVGLSHLVTYECTNLHKLDDSYLKESEALQPHRQHHMASEPNIYYPLIVVLLTELMLNIRCR